MLTGPHRKLLSCLVALLLVICIAPVGHSSSLGDLLLPTTPAETPLTMGAAFAASGTVTDRFGTPIPDVTVSFVRITLSSVLVPQIGQVRTDAAGNWSQTGFTVGVTYKVIPKKGGFTFSPAQALVNVNDTTANFTGAEPPYDVSGTVLNLSGKPVAGIPVYFYLYSEHGIVPSAAITGSDGKWHQSGFTARAHYGARIQKAGYTADPGNLAFAGPRTDLNFKVVGPAYTASGVVKTSTGKPLGGVRITFQNMSGTGNTPDSVLTSATGAWSQTGFHEGITYKATPMKTGFTFTPASRAFTETSGSIDFSSSAAAAPTGNTNL